MTAAILDGRNVASALRTEAGQRAAALTREGAAPRLVAVAATDDPAGLAYLQSVATSARRAGVTYEIADLGAQAGRAEVTETLHRLSGDHAVHGIILATPLPPGLALSDLASAIDPGKDVNGANPVSLGRLAAGLPAFAPATAEAVMRLLSSHQVGVSGRHAVVVGRSAVVGKPLAHLLLGRDATVTVCHSRTADLAAVTRMADILVAAAGRPGLVTPDHVRDGAVVVDVGTSPTPDGGLAGDVDPAVAARASALSPVPGGVGPVTAALLLLHTVSSASGLAGLAR